MNPAGPHRLRRAKSETKPAGRSCEMRPTIPLQLVSASARVHTKWQRRSRCRRPISPVSSAKTKSSGERPTIDDIDVTLHGGVEKPARHCQRRYYHGVSGMAEKAGRISLLCARRHHQDRSRGSLLRRAQGGHLPSRHAQQGNCGHTGEQQVQARSTTTYGS